MIWFFRWTTWLSGDGHAHGRDYCHWHSGANNLAKVLITIGILDHPPCLLTFVVYNKDVGPPIDLHELFHWSTPLKERVLVYRG